MSTALTATGTTAPRSRVSVPSGSSDGVRRGTSSHNTRIKPTSNTLSMGMNINNNSNMTPTIYLQRLVDLSQMDIQSAMEQIKALLTPSQIQKVYKMAYYRKQTKNHWARDDPAFVAIQIALLAIASLAYSIAFRSDSLIYTCLYFCFHSVVINFALFGAIIATSARSIANQHLVVTTSTNHVRQSVEWMYAFDVHCNAFFPAFVLLYVVQFFLLPLVLRLGFVPFLVSNLLHSAAFFYYFYVTHLGYRALPFLSNTEVFLFPLAAVVFVFLLNLVGWPFGFGWNASRIMANIYFEK